MGPMEVLVLDGPMYSSLVASIACFRVLVRAEQMSSQTEQRVSRRLMRIIWIT